MITIVTTTHDRPLCFNILEKWMERQTLKPDQWLVINDSEEPEAYTYNLGQEVVTRVHGQDAHILPSLLCNWLEAIPRIKGDVVLVVEDDDFYCENYIRCLSNLLGMFDLVGVSKDIYYKLPTRHFMRMHNDQHASLAATGFRSSLLPEVERVIHEHKSVFIDMHLWEEFKGKKYLLPQTDISIMRLAFKNMPGAKGLGIGHEHPYSGSHDHNFGCLRQWLGADAGIYMELYSKIALPRS